MLGHETRFGSEQMSAARKLETGGAFLGVERSITGRRWRTREADHALVENFRRRFSLPEIAARLMAVRGVTLDEAEAFMSPTLKTHFPDPSSFTDMDEAARNSCATSERVGAN